MIPPWHGAGYPCTLLCSYPLRNYVVWTIPLLPSLFTASASWSISRTFVCERRAIREHEDALPHV